MASMTQSSIGQLSELTPIWSIRFVLICLATILLSRFIWQQVQIRKKYANLISLPTTNILGNLLGHMEYFWLSKIQLPPTVFFGSVALGISKVVQQMGHGMFYFRVGPFRHIVVAVDAKTTEALLTDNRNIIKAVEYDFMKPWLGDGLLTGTTLAKASKVAHTVVSFRNSNNNKFISVMNDQLVTLVQIVESNMVDGKSVIEGIRPLVNNCTVDIVCQTAMGIEVNAQKAWVRWNESGGNPEAPTPETVYVNAVRSVLDIILSRLITPWLYPDFMFRLFPISRQLKSHIETLHGFTNNVIHKRKDLFEKKFANLNLDEMDESIKHISCGKRIDFLELLLLHHLQDKQDFDLVSIREEVDTFMFGGHDTTSTTLHFALLLIGLNPDKQKLFHDELDTIFGDDIERDISLEDTKHMGYLEMAIKEVLRLYPPAVFFARTISEPLQCGKELIPVGCTFLVYSYAVHRDPEVYDKVEHFIPERFEPNSPVTRHPFAFIPFSAGARNCIGQRFAMLELKIFLASILRRFSIQSLTMREDIELDVAMITKSNTPIQVQFCNRFNK